MNQLPTAEAIATKWALDDGDLLHDAAIEAMKEFAKLHVEAALKEACLQGSFCESRKIWEVTEEEIMSAYPLENIK